MGWNAANPLSCLLHVYIGKQSLLSWFTNLYYFIKSVKSTSTTLPPAKQCISDSSEGISDDAPEGAQLRRLTLQGEPAD